MKFCPYCGASLVGGAAAFCMECGRALPERDAETMERSAYPPVKRRKKPLRTMPAPPKPDPMDEHYDGYYDDVQPIDADRMGERMDPKLAKRIALVILGAAGMIVLSTTLLMLL